MRTEAEVKEALRNIAGALRSPDAQLPENAETAKSLRKMGELLLWVLKDPRSTFEALVMEANRRIDRAERQ